MQIGQLSKLQCKAQVQRDVQQMHENLQYSESTQSHLLSAS